MKRKAQASVFIIVGIVIVAAGAAFFFISNQSTTQVLQSEIPGEAQYAGQEQLRNFIDSCLSEATYQGLEIMRLQAGYIDIPFGVATTKVIANKAIIEENGIKKVVVRQGAQVDVPYWLDSNNLIRIPSQVFVSAQLARYIKDSVEHCVDDFSTFRSDNYNIEKEDSSVRVSFSREVLVELNYPLTFSRGDITFDEEEFVLRVPVNVPKALDLATDIVTTEYVTAFLETNTKTLISQYSYAGGEKKQYHLPPFGRSEPSFSCQMHTWQLNDVKQSLFDNLAQNSQYFAIRGIGEVSEQEEVFAVSALSKEYDQVQVSFIPSAQDYTFDILPRDGPVIRPHRHTATGIKLLPLFCNINYQFKYTTKFPMLTKVEVLDSNALDVLGKTTTADQPFSLTVPVGVHLCGNQPRLCTGAPQYLDEIDFAPAEGFEPQESDFCEPDQRISNPTTINVVDAYTNNPLDDVALFYGCVVDECLVDSSSEGAVDATLPLCTNGYLYGIKPGYAQNKKIITTRAGSEPVELTYAIEPLKEVDVEVRLVDVPTLMANYYMSNGFTNNKCDGSDVEVNDDTLGVEAVGNKRVIISSTHGPAPLSVGYPEFDTTKFSSGTYALSYSVMGKAKMSLPEIDGQTITGDQTALGSGAFDHLDVDESILDQAKSSLANVVRRWDADKERDAFFGNYIDFVVDFSLAEVQQAQKIIFYVPVETTGDQVDILATPAIKTDGSISAQRVLANANCDGLEKTVDIVISKEEVQDLLRPRLE